MVASREREGKHEGNEMLEAASRWGGGIVFVVNETTKHASTKWPSSTRCQYSSLEGASKDVDLICHFFISKAAKDARLSDLFTGDFSHMTLVKPRPCTTL